MKTEKVKSSVKRFGTRYGTTIRKKVGAIESLYRGKKLKCPYCNYIQVRRISAGIWVCNKCGTKFAGKSHTFGETIAVTAQEKVLEMEESEESPAESEEETEVLADKEVSDG